MNNTKYTGVTLAYFCHNSQGVSAVQRSFITKIRTLATLKKETSQLGVRLNKDLKENNCSYLGIHDVFEINGPLKQGAILGRVVLWSYKTIASARKLLKSESEFWINIGKKQDSKRFIAEIVYSLTAPIKYKDRKTIICNVLIESVKQSDVMNKAVQIGESENLKEKIFRVILQYEPKLTNELKFIGIANIKYIYGDVAVGKCFEALCKKVQNVSSAKNLVFPFNKFIPFFKEMNKEE